LHEAGEEDEASEVSAESSEQAPLGVFPELAAPQEPAAQAVLIGKTRAPR